MKDFKKMPKMACGGKVKKMSDGGNTSSKNLQYYADQRSPESKAAAEQRMTEYKEGKEKSSAQFKENMSNIGKNYDKQIAEAKIQYPSTKGGGSSMAVGEIPGKGIGGMRTNKLLYKRGGKVKK